MTLTVAAGLFGHRSRAQFNKEMPDLEGLLWLEPFPRRIRAIADGETIADSCNVQMLNEHGVLPLYYFPRDDVRIDLFEPSEKRTSSESKGEARWWHLRVGDRLIEDAAWEYPEPPG